MYGHPFELQQILSHSYYPGWDYVGLEEGEGEICGTLTYAKMTGYKRLGATALVCAVEMMISESVLKDDQSETYHLRCRLLIRGSRKAKAHRRGREMITYGCLCDEEEVVFGNLWARVGSSGNITEADFQ